MVEEKYVNFIEEAFFKIKNVDNEKTKNLDLSFFKDVLVSETFQSLPEKDQLQICRLSLEQILKNSSDEVETFESYKDLLLYTSGFVFDVSRIPRLNVGFSVGCMEINFKPFIEKATKGLEIFIQIFQLLKPKILNKYVHHSIHLGIFLHLEHSSPQLWTSNKTLNLSKTLLNSIETLTSSSLEDYLNDSGERCAKSRNAHQIFSLLAERLTRDSWKQTPSVPFIFTSLILKLKPPHVSNLFHFLFPPPLLFTDDFEVHHQILGLKGFKHIIENSENSLLLIDRIQVILEAISRLMSSKEEEVLDHVLPLIIPSLSLLSSPPNHYKETHVWSKSDEIFKSLLQFMYLENNFSIKRILSSHLSSLIIFHSFSCLKHSKLLFQVIFSFLQYSDPKGEGTRINALNSLHHLFSHIWPRASLHTLPTTKVLLGVLYQLSLDGADPIKHDFFPLILKNFQLLILFSYDEIYNLFKIITHSSSSVNVSSSSTFSPLFFSSSSTTSTSNLSTLTSSPPTPSPAFPSSSTPSAASPSPPIPSAASPSPSTPSSSTPSPSLLFSKCSPLFINSVTHLKKLLFEEK